MDQINFNNLYDLYKKNPDDCLCLEILYSFIFYYVWQDNAGIIYASYKGLLVFSFDKVYKKNNSYKPKYVLKERYRNRDFLNQEDSLDLYFFYKTMLYFTNSYSARILWDVMFPICISTELGIADWDTMSFHGEIDNYQKENPLVQRILDSMKVTLDKNM